jgi:hypothetical protein
MSSPQAFQHASAVRGLSRIARKGLPQARSRIRRIDAAVYESEVPQNLLGFGIAGPLRRAPPTARITTAFRGATVFLYGRLRSIAGAVQDQKAAPDRALVTDPLLRTGSGRRHLALSPSPVLAPNITIP